MQTVILRPELYELAETPTLRTSDWRTGVVHGAYRDAGIRRVWRLIWLHATMRELAVYRYIWAEAMGGLNQAFLWRPPRASQEVVVRALAPIRAQIRTVNDVAFELLLEQHWTADPAPIQAPWTPFWAPLLTPGAV